MHVRCGILKLHIFKTQIKCQPCLFSHFFFSSHQFNVCPDPYQKGSIAERLTVTSAPKLPGMTPTHTLPWGRSSNSLGPVWTNMYSDPISTTTPTGVGINSPVRVKWRETQRTCPKGLQEEISLWYNLL